MAGHMSVSEKPNGRRDLVLRTPRRFSTSWDDARSKLDALGVEAVCDAFLRGSSMIAFAEEHMIDLSQLLRWILEDAGRSLRVREARCEAAIVWDEMTEALLVGCKDAFELAKAAQLAHHYRWRASKIAPRIYGDHARIEHTGAAGGPIIVSTGLPTDGQAVPESVPQTDKAASVDRTSAQ